jgi:hypothetical protein
MSWPTKWDLIQKCEESVQLANIWLIEKCKEHSEGEYHHDTIRIRVSKTYNKFRALKKNAHRQVGKDRLETFLGEKLELPKPSQLRHQPWPTPLKCSATCAFADVSANLAEELKVAK